VTDDWPAPKYVIWELSRVTPDSVIGDDVMLGRNVSVEGAQIGARTRIQNNVSLYKGVVLGEDCFVGPSAVFTNCRRPVPGYPQEPQPTIVGDRVVIGANATIICGITIGDGAFIGAGSVVTRDVPPGIAVVGNPAREIGS
jgi:UDP-2-acetamido-3-amino-2,3-dideoxy-glucuronate N-acetyltransferase